MKLKKISSWKNFESVESKISKNEIRSWLLESGPITKRIKKNGEDGVILNNQSPENWSGEIIKLLRNKKKIKLMKEKVQLSNNYPSWEDIFYDIFFEEWKSII